LSNPLTIISIDDEEINLLLIEELAKGIDLRIKSFLNSRKALDFIRSHGADIVLIDYMMPELNGIEAISIIHSIDPSTLCVMITAAGDDRTLKLKALEAGATEFLVKPIDAAEFQIRLKNLVAVRRAHNVLQDFNNQLEKEVARATEVIIAREHETLQVLSRTAEYKDPETASHIARVANYSKLLAEEYGLDEKEQEVIFYASPLHDIGKVGIPDAILLKPDKLTDNEFEIIKTHTHIGHDILAKSDNPYLKSGAVISLSHHEKFDGTGYPQGLSGEGIPFYGRITAISDVFDALTSIRPYKQAWALEEAIMLIRNERGKHFDPDLVDIFLDCERDVRSIHTQFGE
jgi:response regulator RpfG family c-di-GMP phosphodiesterase